MLTEKGDGTQEALEEIRKRRKEDRSPAAVVQAQQQKRSTSSQMLRQKLSFGTLGPVRMSEPKIITKEVTTKIDEKFLRVTMPDGSKWDVPVRKIAEHRARYYMKFYPELTTFEKSYNEDTIPLFESDYCDIEEWAANSMNWKEVVAFAREVESHPMTDADFQEGWINGDKEIVEELK